LDQQQISAFLHFGYLPVDPPPSVLREWLPERYDPIPEDTSLDELVARGQILIRKAFEPLASRNPVVPLSGGLDSRLVLARLLEGYEAGSLTTVTFGTPGTFDYEIGRAIARAAGVRNEAIDLTQLSWDRDRMIEFARGLGAPIQLRDSFLYHSLRERFGTASTYWSGYVGDVWAGSYIYSIEPETWAEALDRFVKLVPVRNIRLSHPDFDPSSVLPAAPLSNQSRLTFAEQLLLGVKVESWTKHNLLRPGYMYRTPLVNPEYIKFFLEVPRRFRLDQLLYLEILHRTYPRLFSYPCKNSSGLPLRAPPWRRSVRRFRHRAASALRQLFPAGPWGPHPMLNYLDFDRQLRKKQDLRDLVRESLSSLSRRSVVDWLDLDRLWAFHQSGRANYGSALMTLASLEIHLQVLDAET
jgi:hypothetical protein